MRSCNGNLSELVTSVKFIRVRTGFAKRCKSGLSRYPAAANTWPRIQRELALPEWRAKAIKHPARNFAKLSVVRRCTNNLAILYLFDETEKGIPDDARKREREKEGKQKKGERKTERNVAYEHKQREEDKSPAQYIMRQRQMQYLLASKQDQKTRHSPVGIRVENKLTLGAFLFSRRYLRRHAAASGGGMSPNMYFVWRTRKMNELQWIKFHVYPAQTRVSRLRSIRQFLFCNQDILLMTTRYTIPTIAWGVLFIITPRMLLRL